MCTVCKIMIRKDKRKPILEFWRQNRRMIYCKCWKAFLKLEYAKLMQRFTISKIKITVKFSR